MKYKVKPVMGRPGRRAHHAEGMTDAKERREIVVINEYKDGHCGQIEDKKWSKLQMERKSGTRPCRAL